MSDTSPPKPLPMTIALIDNISGIPGPPLGPQYRITITSPAVILSCNNASVASSSESYTRAGPVIALTFNPDILHTAPSGARLPFNTTNGPVGLSGLLN